MNKKIAILATALAVLTACGTDIGIPTPGNGKGREGWYPITDPQTGDSFRCFYWSLDQSTALWCYEPDITENT